MPREDKYFEGTRPDLRADLVVDGARPSPPGTFRERAPFGKVAGGGSSPP